MYVSVNHDRLVFLHKHPDYHVVRDLDFITRSYESSSCFPLVYGAMEHLTLAELQGLYRNTTKAEPPTSDEETLRQLLLMVAEALPNTDCVPFEVQVQAVYLEERGPVPQGLVYVKGSMRPGKAGDLYALTGTTDPAQLPAARKALAERKLAAQQRANTKPEPSAPGEPSAVLARAAAVARPKSGVCKAIWEALDLDVKMTGAIPPRTRVKELALKNNWSLSTAGVQYGAWLKKNTLP